MKPRGNSRRKFPNVKPRRRGQGDIAPTVPKSYTLPFPVFLEIRKAAREHGSQGRAIQVGSEIALRMKKPPAVKPSDPDLLVRMTYKLTPRTVRVLDELIRTHYRDASEALTACMKTLKMKKIA